MTDNTTTQPEAARPDPTSAGDLEAVLAAAAAAAARWDGWRPAERARALRGVADALDAAADELVPIAMEESHLAEGRLRGELTRTTFQLRLFGDALDEGSCLEAIIDMADPEYGMGPRPDLRRMLVGLGPVEVYSASNFPFAFSVAGGDTASALAAGCPVILKAHSGHPRLSARTGAVVRQALADAGAPDGTFAVIFGTENGKTVLTDPRVKGGSFTGSVGGGRALFDLASSRPEPIPFYGELGSLNPTFVTRGAVAARGEQIAQGYVGSYTLGVGQFCTKPGLLFLPAGHGLDDAIAAASREVSAAPLLHGRIEEGYTVAHERLTGLPGVEVLVDGGPTRSGAAAPTVVKTDMATLMGSLDALLEECFGPTSVIVEYADESELVRAAEAMEGNLTATVHGERDEADRLGALLARLRDKAGRLLWNGWPTGVSVTAAMQHGGPWPATTASIHTSVGTTAIRRFLRPVAYQEMPEALLPEALHDRNVLGIVRRIQGKLTRADVPG